MTWDTKSPSFSSSFAQRISTGSELKIKSDLYIQIKKWSYFLKPRISVNIDIFFAEQPNHQ